MGSKQIAPPAKDMRTTLHLGAAAQAITTDGLRAQIQARAQVSSPEARLPLAPTHMAHPPYTSAEQ